MGGKGGGEWARGGRPRGDPPKIAETATPAKFWICGKHFLLNFGRARGGGRGGPGRRWEEREGGGPGRRWEERKGGWARRGGGLGEILPKRRGGVG